MVGAVATNSCVCNAENEWYFIVSLAEFGTSVFVSYCTALIRFQHFIDFVQLSLHSNLQSLFQFCFIHNINVDACVTDSKTLTEENRNVLFEKLQKSSDTIGWRAEVLMPGFISNSMLKR